MAPRLRPLLTPPNDGTQKENKLDLRVALKTGAGQRDECLNEEIFDSLDDARRKLGLWRHDYNHVRPHSSLGNKTPAEARRALELSEGSAHGALAQNDRPDYQSQTRRLSL